MSLARFKGGAHAHSPVSYKPPAATVRSRLKPPTARTGPKPIDDVRGTAEHRQAMVEVLNQRTLEKAWGMAKGNPMRFETQREFAVQTAF